MKFFSILVLVFLSFTSFAQQNKVIIISNKYEFQKEKNTYNINNMLKAILVSNNYQVFFEDEVLPVEIAQNRCKAFTGVLVDNSNMFLTKMKFQIRDCQNNMLFETAEVKTREKDIQNAYIETIGLLIQNKEVVEPQVIESPKVSEFKTFLNCKMEEIFDGFHVTEVRDSNNFVLLSMQKTKNSNVFIASRDNEIGIFTKTGNKGIFEYYIGDKYMVEEYLF
jgi:hypothetical protein